MALRHEPQQTHLGHYTRSGLRWEAAASNTGQPRQRHIFCEGRYTTGATEASERNSLGDGTAPDGHTPQSPKSGERVCTACTQLAVQQYRYPSRASAATPPPLGTPPHQRPCAVRRSHIALDTVWSTVWRTWLAILAPHFRVATDPRGIPIVIMPALNTDCSSGPP